MKVAKVQFVPWDKTYYFSANGLDLEKGDRVIVKTDLGSEIAIMAGWEEIDAEEYLRSENKPSLFDNTGPAAPDKEKKETPVVVEEAKTDQPVDIKQIQRKATIHDLDKMPKAEERRKAIEYAIKAKEKYDLAMKIIDVHYSYDGSRITFAFIADGRVDFRELVKDLTRHFGRTIRLQQIGIRDEAKCMGDYGHCGKTLCCKGFLPEFISITSEMAELQQCSHRGSERISGVCGRLMCCLYFEQNGYEKLNEKLPAVGTKVNVDGKKGIIVGHHVLKQTVDVEFSGEKGEERVVVEVDINRHKK